MSNPRVGRRPVRTRPKLDRDTILDAGLRLAAAGTADAVSVRKLGAELGADPSAIYRHFRDKDELMLALLDRLQGLAAAEVRAGTDWMTRLRETALALLRVMAAHPAVGAQAGLRSTGGQAERESIERTLAALSEAGLSEPDAVRFYSVYSGFILAFAGAVAAGRLIDPEDEDGLWVGELGAVDADRLPQVSRHAGELSVLTDEQVFQTGVDVILDAAKAAGKASGAKASRTKASTAKASRAGKKSAAS